MTVPDPTPAVKTLPEDPKEFDAAIAPVRVMVRPILHGISRLASSAGTDPLDKAEIDSGEVAFAALMFQYGALLDARVLVALWLAGVTVPRGIQYLERKQKEKAAQAESLLRPTAERLP